MTVFIRVLSFFHSIIYLLRIFVKAYILVLKVFLLRLLFIISCLIEFSISHSWTSSQSLLRQEERVEFDKDSVIYLLRTLSTNPFVYILIFYVFSTHVFF